MDKFDDFLKPSQIEMFDEHQINQYLCWLRLEIQDFILQNKGDSSKYFDLGAFFNKNNISDTQCRKIKDIIIQELKDLEWTLASTFGDTGLIIVPNSQKLNTSIWANSFDFKVL